MEPQLVAEAIAAVSQNRESHLVLDNSDDSNSPLQEIPGIIFIGTNPTLYKIPVTTNLLECLNIATYPEDKTIVRKLVPSRTNHTGMENLEIRRLIFKRFQAFQKLITEMDSTNGNPS